MLIQRAQLYSLPIGIFGTVTVKTVDWHENNHFQVQRQIMGQKSASFSSHQGESVLCCPFVPGRSSPVLDELEGSAVWQHFVKVRNCMVLE